MECNYSSRPYLQGWYSQCVFIKYYGFNYLSIPLFKAKASWLVAMHNWLAAYHVKSNETATHKNKNWIYNSFNFQTPCAQFALCCVLLCPGVCSVDFSEEKSWIMANNQITLLRTYGNLTISTIVEIARMNYLYTHCRRGMNVFPGFAERSKFNLRVFLCCSIVLYYVAIYR